MDGVLIDSEPLWQDAEIEIFGGLGLQLTREMCQDTMGLRIDEVVDHWYSVAPWTGPSKDEVVELVVTRMAELIGSRGELMEGVVEAIDMFRACGMLLAIASSSMSPLIDAVVDGFEIRDRFDVINSAEHEPQGKPDPAVYLTTARRLGVDPSRCIAIEDSLHGVHAATTAGMFCVAIPGEEMHRGTLSAAADMTVDSLTELIERWNEVDPTPA